MDIRRFASYVVVEYSKLNIVQKDLVLYLEDFTKKEPYKEIFDSINSLLTFYKDIIDRVEIRKMDENFMSSKKKFVTYLVARCLKLSEESPTFLEFLLVCTYLGKTAELLLAKYKCCKLLKIIADCLEIVYQRKYKNYFKISDNFSGLADFCRKRNRSKNEECHFKTEVNQRVKIFRHLEYVDESIVLNELEMRLLNTKSFLDPPGDEDSLIVTQESNEDRQEVEVEDWEFVSEKEFKTDIRCHYCKTNCYEYPSHLVKEHSRQIAYDKDFNIQGIHKLLGKKE